MCTEGRALAIARNCETGEGLELWAKNSGGSRARCGYVSGCLLAKTLIADFDMSDFLGSLEKKENLIKQHDAVTDESEGVQDRVNSATLISR